MKQLIISSLVDSKYPAINYSQALPRISVLHRHVPLDSKTLLQNMRDIHLVRYVELKIIIIKLFSLLFTVKVYVNLQLWKWRMPLTTSHQLLEKVGLEQCIRGPTTIFLLQ